MAEKQLYRSRTNRVIGGVAGGLAEYFNTDPLLVRLVFIALTFWTGVGFFLYLVAWFLIPEEPLERAEAKTKSSDKEEPKKDPKADFGDRAQKVAQDIQDAAERVDKEWNKEARTSQPNVLIGLILLVVGLMLLADSLSPVNIWARFWPLIIIAVGIGIMVKGSSKE